MGCRGSRRERGPHLRGTRDVEVAPGLREAHDLGVRLFVLDSPGEVAKLADAAPGASMLVRIVTSGSGSDWPLSRKYGCSVEDAVALLRDAARLGLDPAGVSFHVGSQQRDPQAWGPPIRSAARVFEAVRAHGIRPWLLDLGGGFPAALEGGEVPSVSEFGAAIEAHLADAFGKPGCPLCRERRRTEAAYLESILAESVNDIPFRQALAAYVRLEPDLVLLDLTMPEVDGFEACRMLKDNPCLLYTSPSPRDRTRSRMPSSA